MEEKITEKQSKYLHKLYEEKGVTDAEKAEMLKRFGVEHTKDLLKIDASTLIDELMMRGIDAEVAGTPKMADYKKDDTPQSVIVQTAKPDYAPEKESAETALAPIITGIVRPMVSPEEAVAVWKDYEILKQKVISKDDIQQIQDKDYIKKSGWRKMATLFNLSDEIAEEIKEINADGSFLWRIKVKVTAPNGRTSIGVGICDSRERKFAHEEHDVYAQAHTRAKNRGISDLVGGGSVSAEEIES